VHNASAADTLTGAALRMVEHAHEATAAADVKTEKAEQRVREAEAEARHCCNQRDVYLELLNHYKIEVPDNPKKEYP
jgi:hypothetical protein